MRGGRSRSRSVKSVKKQIEFVCPVLVSCLSSPLMASAVTRDGLQASPDLSCVILLQVVFHPGPVAGLSLLDLLLQLLLHPPQLLFVPRSKSPPLLLQQGLQFRGHPGFIVRETSYSPGGYGVFYTEVNIVRDAVCQHLYSEMLKGASSPHTERVENPDDVDSGM